MKIKELKKGDCITQQHHNSTITFEIVAVQPMGQRFLVTFNSIFGTESACYPADACLTAT